MFACVKYGSLTVAEDTPVGHTLLTITATDNDEPDSGSSVINFHISSGNEDGFFTVESNGTGVGHVVVAKVNVGNYEKNKKHTEILVSNMDAVSWQPLDFEASPTYRLQIDARNPEPLTKGLNYDSKSSAVLSVSLTDVDEVPEFSLDVLDVTVPENITEGSVLLTVEANDPEGKEIRYSRECCMFITCFCYLQCVLYCISCLSCFQAHNCPCEVFKVVFVSFLGHKRAANWSKQMSLFYVCL